MTSDELIQQFECGDTPAETFHHADHVRLAFEYLRRYSAIEALERFSNALRRFAAAQGKADRYHETITWTYLLLIRERMARRDYSGRIFVKRSAGRPATAEGKADSPRAIRAIATRAG